MKKHNKGFTLIELLVVVLIIGVLAAIALPQYNKAVARSRFNALMPIAKAMSDANEAYYLEHNGYAINPQDLPVEGKNEYPTGTTLELSADPEYAYVRAQNSSVPSRYVMYQKHSENYPGEIHCEAEEGNSLAQSICEGVGGSQNLGQVFSDGYVTYVLAGKGMGLPHGAGGNAPTCDAATAMGLTCSITTNEQGQQVKQMCKELSGTIVCRTKTYNEDGGYTSITCEANSEGVCTSTWQTVAYDANGNQTVNFNCYSLDSDGTCFGGGGFSTYDANGKLLSFRDCYGMAPDGTCSAYCEGDCSHSDYTYDEHGNTLSQISCSSIDSNGNCTGDDIYSYNYNYTYDENGNMLTQRNCDAVDSNGKCTAYSGGSDYTYDENGKKLSVRNCDAVDSNGKCTEYNTYYAYDYTYDENGNMLTVRQCSSIDNSNGNCTAYTANNSVDKTFDANGNMVEHWFCSSMDSDGNCGRTRGYLYTYDENGKTLTSRYCIGTDSNGHCTTYGNISINTNSTYDANGNQLTSRTCTTVDSNGNCTAYSSGSNYTYDENGTRLTRRNCSSMDSSGNCTAYGSAIHYAYDDNGKEIARQQCSGSNINAATGECLAYNSIEVMLGDD